MTGAFKSEGFAAKEETGGPGVHLSSSGGGWFGKSGHISSSWVMPLAE